VLSSPPWGGEDTHELLGRVRGRTGNENRTSRPQERTMQQLLSWSIRFIEDFAEDILTAHTEHQHLGSVARDRRRLRRIEAGKPLTELFQGPAWLFVFQ
jgi:hypothetical protein